MLLLEEEEDMKGSPLSMWPPIPQATALRSSLQLH